MATNDFRIFANGQKLIGEETLNIAPLDDEQLTTETKTGFYSGLASSKKFNRVLRQGTAGTTTIADLIVDVLAEDVKDDGTTFKEQLRRAITKTVELDSKSFVRTINGKAPDASGDAVGGDTLNAEVLAACDKALTDTVQTTGQTELAQVMSAVASLESKSLSKSTPHVTESWHAEDGSGWYRVWSDGWKEQGGGLDLANEQKETPVTFPKAFKLWAQIQISKTRHTGGDGWVAGASQDSITLTGFSIRFDYLSSTGVNNIQKVSWYACGF